MHALLIGASGLIGSHILNQLIDDHKVSKITLLLRRAMNMDSPKIQQHIINFDEPESWCHFFENVDVVFCSIGTTRSKTPNLDDYRKIDFDIPVNAINCAEKYAVSKFMLVSSVGADANSRNFYLKIKGEVENALKHSKVPIQGVFQPSLLLGNRQEKRFGEGLARTIMPLFNFLVPMKYKAIQASDVAHSMITASKNQVKPKELYWYKQMIHPT